MSNIKELVQNTLPAVVSWRRHLHAHPELSDQEKETSAYVQSVLTELGIPFNADVFGYAVIGEIKGGKPGKTVALRADMDALPIAEENDVPFASQNAGVMHACGHDSHVAILLGTAAVLNTMKDELAGTVKLVFQPAEEKSPIGGAKGVLASGVLDDVDEIYGLHVWPELPVGKIGFRSGPLMAASDHFYVNIKGKATHAAEPHNGVDALVAAANWIVSAQAIVARQVDPMDNAVLTIGTMQAGVRYNVVAENVAIEGTCRTFNPAVRDYVETKLGETLKGLDAMFGTTSTLDYQRGYGATINHAESIEFMKGVTGKYLGEEYIVEPMNPSMCAEDFSAYLTQLKGAFLWLGTGFEGNPALHNSRFNIDEEILGTGITMMSGAVIEFLA